MKKRQFDTRSVVEAAMWIVEGEHADFVSNHIDNEKHISRIVRIAESAGSLLAVGGRPKRTVDSNIQRIIRYGRQLFIHEWADPITAKDELEAIAEFNRHVPENRKEQKLKSSNQAL